MARTLPKVQNRTLVQFPSPKSLDDFDSKIGSIERNVVTSRSGVIAGWLAADPLSALNKNPQLCLAPLAHRLSPFALARSYPQHWRAKSMDEAMACQQIWPLWSSVLEAPSGTFQTVIERTCSAAVRQPTSVRTRGVGISRDNKGYAVEFPPPSDAVRRLEELAAWLPKNAFYHGVTRAVVFMACLLNSHPFLDGNGRTARIGFNAILQDRHRGGTFIPLYEIMALSALGFELRLRTLEVTGDWSELFEYFLSLFEIIHDNSFKLELLNVGCE